jgi:hypothetical protein
MVESDIVRQLYLPSLHPQQTTTHGKGRDGVDAVPGVMADGVKVKAQ